ncbi:hypothetical protein HYH03_010827 [Edaphochlamys debaryana]|uniref:DNA-directed RNA polymerase II subunit RPB7 n=1 Tax=Edaphochlamys debaryana TaxID=47281 RepID=A0A836BX85_9CHLO|nr:hypothetical protein HYH03_010827 [Edaphochlamys debaryana]|eukprot:KAG2490914.1 hypothetical protein HYH03_010827 [Edaphochlamys debaryana]
MFYYLRLTKSLDIHPKHFGPKLSEVIREKLIAETEGTCTGKYGYVVAVTRVDNISKGRIRQDQSGYATFEVEYGCIVCRPYKGEVLDAVVTSVNKMGFFAQAGPLQLFVTQHLIPEEFEASDDNAFVSMDQTTRIQAGTHVRVRIVGIKYDPTEVFCIATMKQDYLGVIGSDVI